MGPPGGRPRPPPETMGPSGCRRYSNRVTMPKLPPPPRRPQNRSAFSSSLAWTTSPSARTTSAPIMLSTVYPSLRSSQPEPLPSVSPAMPVVGMRPPGMASPCSWVAASNSPQFTPPPASDPPAALEVGGVRRLSDDRRPPVYHGVEHRAGGVIAAVPRKQYPSAEI